VGPVTLLDTTAHITNNLIAKCLLALIAVAFLLSVVLPKDHSVARLGPGCYYSSVALVVGKLQREICDDWRRP
jgi:hypothetical protein